jgi:cytochrome c oxidase cbb3-type subunit 3
VHNCEAARSVIETLERFGCKLTLLHGSPSKAPEEVVAMVRVGLRGRCALENCGRFHHGRFTVGVPGLRQGIRLSLPRGRMHVRYNTPRMKVSWLGVMSAIALLAAGTETKVKLPSSRGDLANGEKLFQHHCALCHGPKGEGGRGPMLTQAKLSRATDDAALLKILEEGIRGTEMPGADSMSEHEMRQTAAFVRSLGKVPIKPVPGNPARGAEIYRGKGACGTCHSIKGQGGISGPDLASIGLRRSAGYLHESLVDPQAAVPDEYLLVKVVTKKGQNVTGVRVNEDSFSIQIRDDSGRSHSFWKYEVEQIDKQRAKSPMPSYKDLAEDELTDLVAYLASLKEGK